MLYLFYDYQKSQFFEPLKTHFWYPFWNPILGADLPKKQQDEPKRAIRSFKDQKTAFSKPLKNIVFLHVFGSRGFPREPQETQEDSQEAIKELKNLKKSKKTKIRAQDPMVENALARRSRPRARSTGLFEGLVLNMFWIIF